ncbi:hypothetical protein LV84_01807 [Algoriphagus ratkowskyi]|uniref:Lipocalin-like protein n=1 Tax=Algoriphagus ratkowskyi TaxID=57028 RepID=A0A2W7R9T5_9BACT|nr:hypothetical protein [Algoriphagus ratkowskyi]PZX57678.1 hypothetical protein LV84_01807 [Algoriphagus ratkowskyi]TXD78949.1 hypothetical protein ESW18_05375 [Algoriphagus ratkowskyi]
MRNFTSILLLSIFGAFLFSSCQEDEKPIDNSTLVLGYWQTSIASDENMLFVSYYTFLENGIFHSASVYLDADSKDLAGYSSRSSGEYTLLDDQLTTHTTIVYGVPESSDAPYVQNTELVQKTDSYSFERKVKFTEDKMIWISPGCGPLENCIGDQVFERYISLDF